MRLVLGTSRAPASRANVLQPLYSGPASVCTLCVGTDPHMAEVRSAHIFYLRLLGYLDTWSIACSQKFFPVHLRPATLRPEMFPPLYTFSGDISCGKQAIFEIYIQCYLGCRNNAKSNTFKSGVIFFRFYFETFFYWHAQNPGKSFISCSSKFALLCASHM